MTMTTTATPLASSTAPLGNKKWLPRLFQRSNSTSADIISTHHNDREGDTEFFASLEENRELAFLDLDEIEVDPLAVVGRGTFTCTAVVVGVGALKGDWDSGRRREIAESLWRGPVPRYALKQLTPETLQSPDPKTLSRAARELVNDAKYLARLSHHPNIVTLRGLTRDAYGNNYLAHQFQDFFLLLDNISGQTLHDKIYNEWRTDDEPNEDLIPMKANYAFQIAKALRFCHQQGVLYRDLKPASVGFSLLDPHCVQLLEFGLARDIPNTTHSAPFRMTLAGTRRYLAGEVLTTGEYTFKSDVYSWAMTFYEMATERKPYHGLSATEHQVYVCENGSRPTLEDYYMPDQLDVIFTHAWHPHLDKRWSMNQVCAAMQSFLMELDIAYYQQKEGDFLFDIEPTPIHVPSWTEEFGREESLASITEQVDQPTGYFYMEHSQEFAIMVGDECESHDDAGMKTSRRASMSSSRRASLSSTIEPVTPRKVISSAA